MTATYGIAEWYGHDFAALDVQERQRLARTALRENSGTQCPFQPGNRECSKKGGVCCLREYGDLNGRAVITGPPVIVCPYRLAQDGMVATWLAEIMGFQDPYMAREVPFMRSPTTGRSAGKIDLVVAAGREATDWAALEIQAVYFSGGKMAVEFEALAEDAGLSPPFPQRKRRPDWRSSSAKRLMPQLEVKVPLLRQWGKKLAVAVDPSFFDAIGGKSPDPSRDINDGDIVWLVPEISEDGELEPYHWEVLSLESSAKKLLSAETIKREEFEAALRDRLHPP